MLLANKVAFITGAGSGIGKATALLFAHEGAHIAAVDASAEELERTVAQIEEVGAETLIN